MNVIEATSGSINEFKACSTVWDPFLIPLTGAKLIAGLVLGLMSEPNIIILLSGHSNILPPNFISLYPSIIASLNLHQLHFAVDRD